MKQLKKQKKAMHGLIAQELSMKKMKKKNSIENIENVIIEMLSMMTLLRLKKRLMIFLMILEKSKT